MSRIEPTITTIMLFNSINPDGVGDFSHLVDIYLALSSNPKLKGYQFVPCIVYGNEQGYEYAKEQLVNMNIPLYFMEAGYDFVKKFENDPTFLQHIKNAQQFLIISYSGFPGMDKWQEINPVAPVKFIGEHEDISCYGSDISRSLGLSEDCYGIKFRKLPRLQPQEAGSLLDKEAKDFVTSLLTHTKSKDFTEFYQRHVLIPAYCNKTEDFAKFLNFLSWSVLSKNQDIALFLSGRQLRQSDLGYEIKKSNIKQVILIKADQKPVLLDCNLLGTSTLFVFYGMRVNNIAYQALYQQALIAFVSGDNTFELAAGLTLPWYRSTNAGKKGPTTYALREIIKKLDLSKTVKKDFLSYFSMIHQHRAIVSEVAQKIDLLAMIAAWPKVAAYLMKHHNFYDQLENILFETLNLSLLKAVKENKYPHTLSLLDGKKADVCYVDEGSQTALIEAVKSSNGECSLVDELLWRWQQKLADNNGYSAFVTLKHNAFWIAREQGYHDLVHLLLAYDAHIDEIGNSSYFFQDTSPAIEKFKQEVCQQAAIQDYLINGQKFLPYTLADTVSSYTCSFYKAVDFDRKPHLLELAPHKSATSVFGS